MGGFAGGINESRYQASNRIAVHRINLSILLVSGQIIILSILEVLNARVNIILSYIDY